MVVLESGLESGPWRGKNANTKLSPSHMTYHFQTQIVNIKKQGKSIAPCAFKVLGNSYSSSNRCLQRALTLCV